MNIPIDNELQAFDSHLKKNNRVIFSAPFGDGKSYFLNQFQKIMLMIIFSLPYIP